MATSQIMHALERDEYILRPAQPHDLVAMAEKNLEQVKQELLQLQQQSQVYSRVVLEQLTNLQARLPYLAQCAGVKTPARDAATAGLSAARLSATEQELARLIQDQGIDKSARIYVAGHQGMVGSACVRLLHKLGFSRVYGAPSSKLDLRKQDQVERFLALIQPDYVVLAAAKVGGILANRDYPLDFLSDNLLLQSNILNNVGSATRVIFLGSSCIYPKFAPQPMVEECLLTSALEPTNRPYALAKIAGIEHCWAANRQNGRNAQAAKLATLASVADTASVAQATSAVDTKAPLFLALMPTNLYGLGDYFHQQKSHVIPALLQRMVKAKLTQADDFVVWGTGKAQREFLAVDDLAQAVVFSMFVEEAKLVPYLNDDQAPIFNVGTGLALPIAQLVHKLAELVDWQGELVFDTSKPDGTPLKQLNVGRMKQLGWEYSTKLEAGLAYALLAYLAGLGRGEVFSAAWLLQDLYPSARSNSAPVDSAQASTLLNHTSRGAA